MEPLITARELLPHLDDPEWVIVDCTFDLIDPGRGETEYLEAHIPGAVYADLERDLSAERDGTNGRHPLPSPDDLAKVFSSLGIAKRNAVVAYDRNGSPYAARLWWSLRYLGVSKVTVLDGGFQAWIGAGYPVRSGPERRTPAHFVPAVQPHMLASVEEIQAGLGRGEELLLDARSAVRYRGEEEPYDPVAGHIPGAVNFDWEDDLDEIGRFKPAAFLRREYERLLGPFAPPAAIAYCGSGVTSCHVLLGMEHVGIHGTRLYAGSWSEWCSDPARPVAVGDGPSTESHESRASQTASYTSDRAE